MGTPHAAGTADCIAGTDRIPDPSSLTLESIMVKGESNYQKALLSGFSPCFVTKDDNNYQRTFLFML
jgi:hypothetical protein